MPTIRIDDGVYVWLQSQAVPFEDNPNSVLRRLAGMGAPRASEAGTMDSQEHGEGMDMKAIKPTKHTGWKGRRQSGKELRRIWNVNVQQALYHRDGTFFENLNRFPGALFDPNGYVVFATQEEYDTCRYLNIGKKLNVPGGIVVIPGYKRMRS